MTQGEPAERSSRLPQGNLPIVILDVTERADSRDETPVEIYIRSGSLREQLREAWESRDVAVSLIREQLTWRRGARLKLGLWWYPIRIVCSTLVFGLIFGGVLGAPSEGDIPYFLFVTGAMFAFWIFQHGTLASLQSFYRFKNYVNNFAFPLVLIPVVGMAYLWLGIAFFAVYLVGAAFVFWGIDGRFYLDVSPGLLLVPVCGLWLVVLAVTIGLFTAPVFRHAKDIRNVYRLILPLLLFVTPIIYPLSTLDGTAAVIAGVNPLAAPIELFRKGLFGIGGIPTYSLFSAIGATVLLLAGGLLFLRRVGLRMLWIDPRPTDPEDDDV
jgi:lipopolysaccharide transport system permease protein